VRPWNRVLNPSRRDGGRSKVDQSRGILWLGSHMLAGLLQCQKVSVGYSSLLAQQDRAATETQDSSGGCKDEHGCRQHEYEARASLVHPQVQQAAPRWSRLAAQPPPPEGLGLDHLNTSSGLLPAPAVQNRKVPFPLNQHTRHIHLKVGFTDRLR